MSVIFFSIRVEGREGPMAFFLVKYTMTCVYGPYVINQCVRQGRKRGCQTRSELFFTRLET